MGLAHERRELAAFQDGETRLVFARYRDRPPELYYLEDGTAAQLRPWAKEHLECFMPVCDNRRLTTVARRDRRDGFAHMRGAGGHAPESQFHVQAKELIARWVHRWYPQLEVRIEQATDGRSRVADVMITSQDPPGRLAVEIQYSKLDPAEWQARHDSYMAQGINDVWLLGHHGRHLRTTRDNSNTAELGVLHRTILAAGQPLLWINPILALVGTAVVDASQLPCDASGCTHGEPGDGWFVGPSSTAAAVLVAQEPLDKCRLVRGRFETPVMRGFATTLQAWRARRASDHAEAALERQAAARAAAAASERLRRARLAARAAALAQKEAFPESADGRVKCWRCGEYSSDPVVIRIGAHVDQYCNRNW